MMRERVGRAVRRAFSILLIAEALWIAGSSLVLGLFAASMADFDDPSATEPAALPLVVAGVTYAVCLAATAVEVWKPSAVRQGRRSLLLLVAGIGNLVLGAYSGILIAQGPEATALIVFLLVASTALALMSAGALITIRAR